MSKLLDQVRHAVRARHYSRRTEHTYVSWIRRFVFFHGKRHPVMLGGPEVAAYLTHLATRRRVSASTQTQALSAILFLYRNVLHVEISWLDEIPKARRPRHLPVVLTPAEVASLISRLDSTARLVCELLYGTGMRLLRRPLSAREGPRLRPSPDPRPRRQGR
jgi:site-specific recombinase XerD